SRVSAAGRPAPPRRGGGGQGASTGPGRRGGRPIALATAAGGRWRRASLGGAAGRAEMATATATLTANRPYDHLYDTSYISSHQNDHYRATNKAMLGPNCLERVPDSQYLFSELPHYPRAGIQ
ncbi:unnamed protein product, partial [Prorocentrum cordatum]